MNDVIRVFCGSDINGCCSENQMVFEYSLRKHSSRPIELVWMKISDDPSSFWYGWNTELWSTPFSGFRYGIAEYCNFKGKAIYCDDDQVWLEDPAKLWDIDISDENIMTGKLLPNGEIRHCVSLIDCEKFGKKIAPASRRKQNANFCDMMKAATFPYTQIINGNWNNLDGENEAIENIKLLHLTDMSTQPGVKESLKRLGDQGKHLYSGEVREHRRKDIEDVWYKYYYEALEAGYKVEDYVPETRIEFRMIDQKHYVARNGFDVTLGE